jgi:hypothetical protein
VGAFGGRRIDQVIGRRTFGAGGHRASMFRWHRRPPGEEHATTPPSVAHAPPSLRSEEPILELTVALDDIL